MIMWTIINRAGRQEETKSGLPDLGAKELEVNLDGLGKVLP